MTRTVFMLLYLISVTPLFAQEETTMEFQPEPDHELWQAFTPDLPAVAVERQNDEFPLSDQVNSGNWKPYEPMWDEFNNNSLDPARWHDCNPTWPGRQPAWFWKGNITVENDNLNLTMRQYEPPDMPRDNGYNTYTSAAVKSTDRVLYGYFEIRAKPMKSHGSSAFWLYYADEEQWTEIDIFEIGGGSPVHKRRVYMTQHVFHTPLEDRHWSIGGFWEAPYDLVDDYHVYGCEWTKEEIKFYVDGVLLRQGPNTHWHQALHLNFDSETMPDWFGMPNNEDLPSTFSIDYIRTWQQEPK